MLISKYGAARAMSTAATAIRWITGRCNTLRVTQSQNLPRLMSPLPRFIWKAGIFQAYALSPSNFNRAGKKVSEARTVTATTRIAPSARPRNTVVGTINMPASAITTIMPGKKTA